jgi:hypothetical protein
MLTNKEVIKIEKEINTRAKKGKIAYIKKKLSLEEAMKKSLCRIIVAYLVQNKMTSLQLAKKLRMYKNQMERASLYQYNKISFEFLIDVVNKLSTFDKESFNSLNQLIKTLNHK